ncbi:MAG: DUF488 domain-containing protein [Sphingomonadales bacterium]|nr:DUF488 domain-containing protein [Sphingomonadales bacterium]
MDYPLQTKRIYEPKAASDGQRVLVDRIWPRGVSKAAAALDLWLKDVAPSTELRKWFAHRPDRWADFQRRYFLELEASAAMVELRTLTQAGPVTLLYAARDRDHNEAVALAAFLKV